MRSTMTRAGGSIVAIAISASALGTALSALAETAVPSSSDLVATLLPSAVSITVIRHIPATASTPGVPIDPNAYKKKKSFGSGFIVDHSGVLVTNRHVITGVDEIYVILNDNTKLKATLLYQAPIDIALLKIDAGPSAYGRKMGR
jgi:S1-C subfamily serine protease